jgi:hypothetical protein
VEFLTLFKGGTMRTTISVSVETKAFEAMVPSADQPPPQRPGERRRMTTAAGCIRGFRNKTIFGGVTLWLLAAAGCTSCWDKGVDAVGRNDAIVLEGDGGAKVLVSPKLQGRIMNASFDSESRVGWINYPEIAEGETHPGFNNFGGQDRFWLGPEGGPYSIYFAPGVKFDRSIWVVPPDFDKGPFTVVEKTPKKVLFRRDMNLTNYKGTKFQAKVEREVGVIPTEELKTKLGVELPAGVAFGGSYSDNVLANAGSEPWKKDTGLLNIWILGQFVPGPRTVIIAPFKPGEGKPYRDDVYFGAVPADRLMAVGNAMVFRADGYKEGKFGIPQARTTGLAGSYDYERNLLVVIRFDVPSELSLYADSAWKTDMPDPYAGDLFQCYNSDRMGKPDQRAAFYELESVSPSKELAPGEKLRHRQETYCFNGDPAKLKEIAAKTLGVDLDAVQSAMFGK